ncbi:MAG: ATP-binding protein [Candidatus Omnitrophota bacterium]|nr:ATP-binding protein [Candidatus Omnitrophota bacterium]
MKNLFKNLNFLTKNRFIIFGFFCAVFIIVQYFSFGAFLPSAETKDLWFYSGIFMVLFSILFIEPYYTSPKNVITNAIPLLLVFLAIKTSFENVVFWWTAVAILLLLLLASIVALAFDDKDKSPDHWKNKTATKLKDIVVIAGQGRVLYSAVFIYFLLTYHSIQNFYTLSLFILWFFILSINPKNIHGSFAILAKKDIGDQIGEIFSVQSKKIFLVKLFEDRKSIKKFDVVKFRYSMQDAKDFTITGIVFDTYLLNQEKWAKILQLADSRKEDEKLEKNIVYKIASNAEINVKLKIDNLAGVVIDGSTIGKIKFEYSKKNDDLQEGDLLELNIGVRRLFYQVIGGRTEKEKLEARNETGFIEGEAIQLGEWRETEFSFQKFGWVPSINTPVFKTDASDIRVRAFTYPNYKLGKIPNTELPSVVNLSEAVSHHMALVGVTGSGKSFLVREIINQIKVDTKVICVDFNKEFVSMLMPAPTNIISDTKAEEISEKIDWINNELEKFGNQQDKAQIARKQTEIKTALEEEIESFLNDATCSIKVFELPDVSNTTGILDYTKYFFKVLFEVAKKKQVTDNPAKICVVLEEAHTIIPEWNFSGSGDKTSQGLVNSIGQITLQGRKYGVGFLVVTQRTANVSKTVLTQCNTVICFQAFDETSFTFLGNYIGKDMVQVLPNLKQYHAVVAGKAVKANMPMIIDLTR